MLATSLLMFGLFGCPTPADTDPGLPPADTDRPPRETDVSTFPVETDLGEPVVEDPLHRVTLRQWGRWDLGPGGGPYQTLSGVLYVQEYIDGARPDTDDTDPLPDTDDVVLECDLEFALSGVPALSTCSGCAFAFEVTHTLTLGDPSLCHDPDLPIPDERIRLGFNESQTRIYLDYGDIGLWLPWYPAEKTGDRVEFEWASTLGISIEEEEE